MSQHERYIIREWGEGFWRWSCIAKGSSTKGHWGIVGAPFTREDARRAAEEHWAQAHADAPPPVDASAADVTPEAYPEKPRRRAEDPVVASALLQRLQRASDQRRERPQA